MTPDIKWIDAVVLPNLVKPTIYINELPHLVYGQLSLSMIKSRQSTVCLVENRLKIPRRYKYYINGFKNPMFQSSILASDFAQLSSCKVYP